MSTVSGSCLCGDVKIDLTLPALWSAHCHCSYCQRAHGAPLVTWVGAADSTYTITAKDLRWYASSAQGERAHCGRCGTPMFFRSQRWPGELHIVRTCFHGEVLPLPQAHVYCQSSARWFENSDALPRYNSVPSEQK